MGDLQVNDLKGLMNASRLFEIVYFVWYTLIALARQSIGDVFHVVIYGKIMFLFLWYPKRVLRSVTSPCTPERDCKLRPIKWTLSSKRFCNSLRPNSHQYLCSRSWARRWCTRARCGQMKRAGCEETSFHLLTLWVWSVLSWGKSIMCFVQHASKLVTGSLNLGLDGVGFRSR